MRRLKLPLIVLSIIIVLAILLLVSQQKGKTVNKTGTIPGSTAPQPSQFQFAVDNYKGAIASLTNSSISINTGAETKNLSISGNFEIFRMTPKSAKAEVVHLNDLKVGQQVAVATRKNSNQVILIMIEK